MPLAWEYNLFIHRPNNFPIKVIDVPSHMCGGNPQYSRYYKSCRVCTLFKKNYKKTNPNLNQRSTILQPCIHGFDEFTYAMKFYERPRMSLGLLKF